MRSIAWLLAISIAGVAYAQPSPPPPPQPTKPVPSGPVKAFKGPEGELVAMVEANDGKQMLVYFRNVAGDLDGKTLDYLYEDHGDHKEVYLNYKRGSKWYRTVLLSASDNQWEFFHPTKPTIHFRLRYSEKDSEKMRVDDVVKALKP